MKAYALAGALLLGVLPGLLSGCGSDAEEAVRNGEASPAETQEGLTAFQEEHGIGPITSEVRLDGAVDPEMAAMGEELFQNNCEACHLMEDRFVGPALGDVMERRSPAFILNMILNPEQMAREHPEVQRMMQEYPLIMPYQNISEEGARAILEYLRTVGD